MSEGFKAKRVGTFTLKSKDEDGNYETLKAGALITTKYEGNYRVIFELPTGRKTEEGYDEMEQVAAIKTASMEKGRNIQEAYLHLNLWEDCKKRPPRQD